MSNTRTGNGTAEKVRLTQLAASAGCAAKLSQMMLHDVFARLTPAPRKRDPCLLVDASTFDDAGVYRLSRDVALVQTVDFFTPIVDDPFDFGQIAAANALSDVYAMGGRPLTAMNLLGVPANRLDAASVSAILDGGAAMVRSADCALVGGHTIKTAEPIYGLSVTGVVHPSRLLANDAARPGDQIVLTKPLGVGIASTAVKRGIASPLLVRRAVRAMKMLNTPGAELAESRLVRAATDVTGFGLTGHLANVVRASGVVAKLDARAIPVLSKEVRDLIAADCVPGGTRANLAAAESIVDFGDLDPHTRVLLADAQTSGPLMLFVARARLDRVLKVLKRHRTLAAAVIGQVVKGRPAIVVR